MPARTASARATRTWNLAGWRTKFQNGTSWWAASNSGTILNRGPRERAVPRASNGGKIQRTRARGGGCRSARTTLERLNLGVVGEAEYAALRQYGVRQVILDRDAFPLKVSPFGPAFTLAGLRASPFLELAHAPTGGEPLWIFRVRERPGPPGGDE